MPLLQTSATTFFTEPVHNNSEAKLHGQRIDELGNTIAAFEKAINERMEAIELAENFLTKRKAERNKLIADHGTHPPSEIRKELHQIQVDITYMENKFNEVNPYEKLHELEEILKAHKQALRNLEPQPKTDDHDQKLKTP